MRYALRRKLVPGNTITATRRWTPALERLEPREVPTIAFTPLLPDTTAFAPSGATIAETYADSLSSPSVDLIFAGRSWRTSAQGRADRQTITAAVQSILNGPYLSGLTQYASDGKAVYGTSWQDDDFPMPLAGNDQNPSDAALDAFIRSSAAGHAGRVSPGANVLYMVFNDPGDSGRSPYTHGFNTSGADGVREAYVAAKLADGALDKDDFTWVFSHELAESMAADVCVKHPGSRFHDGVQISDNEPEDGLGYVYRLGDNLVQAYWSQRDGAYIVPDGNADVFTLVPHGTTDGVPSGGFDLVVHEDQAGGAAHALTLDYAGAVTVALDGQLARFDPAYDPIANVVIDSKRGSADLVQLGSSANALDHFSSVTVNGNARTRVLVVDVVSPDATRTAGPDANGVVRSVTMQHRVSYAPITAGLTRTDVRTRTTATTAPLRPPNVNQTVDTFVTQFTFHGVGGVEWESRH